MEELNTFLKQNSEEILVNFPLFTCSAKIITANKLNEVINKLKDKDIQYFLKF